MMQRRDVLKVIGAAALPLGIGWAGRAQAAVDGAVDYGWNPAIAAPTEADLYVAPGGDDGAAGTPDSPLQTIQAGIDRLIASGGRSLCLRGGLYRQAASLRNLKGAEGAPVLIHRYGSEPVTISAADVITGWQPCADQDAAALGVAVTGLYVVRLPRAQLTHDAPLALNLHEAGEWLSVATERADMQRLDSPSDDSRFFTAPQIALSADGRVQGFADPRLRGLTAAQMKGVRVLFHHAPNVVSPDPIGGFDPVKGTIQLAGQGQKVQREQNQPVVRYALQNIATALTPGSWLVREEDDGKMLAVYLNPRDPAHLNGGIEISTRGICLDLGSAAHVTLVGMEFVRASGDKLRTAVAINHPGGVPAPQRAHDITFSHCRVAETFSSAARGEGAIFIRGLTNLTMRNFTVDHVRGSFGVALHDCVGSDLRHLHLHDISQSAGRFFGARQMIFAFSLIENSAWEAHANKFNFYQGSDLILVYGIRTRNTGGYVTYQKASRIHFGFCEFDASASNPDNRALASQNRPSGMKNGGKDQSGDPVSGGTFWYWNLTLAPNPYVGQPPRALSLGPGGSTQRHAYHNCLLYGGGFDDIYQKGADPAGEQRSHNLYTALAFWQKPQNGWQMAQGEALIGLGQRPSATGRDMRDLIQSLTQLFPTFTDWDRDIDYRPVTWRAPPIGCTTT